MREEAMLYGSPGDFTFLRDVYKEECENAPFSPDLIAAANLEQANSVAVKLLAALNIYGPEPDDRPYASRFPIKHIDDPCGNLPSLPLRLTPGYGSGWSIFKTIAVHSPSRLKPDKQYSLGTLAVFDPDEAAPGVLSSHGDPYIARLNLHRFRFGGQRPEFAKHPSQTEKGFIDGYPLNSEAMNLINLVDQYLEQLDRSRLAVVS